MDSLMVLTMPESTVHAPSGDATSPGDNGAPVDSSAALRDAIAALRAGADVQVSPIAMPGDLDGALHRRGSRKIVIAGGDAGLHAVVSALHRRKELDDAVLAMIPAGPGGARSAFARGAGIPNSPPAAARMILDSHEQRFDLLMDCRGEVVVNGAAVAGRPDRRSRAFTGLRSVSGVGAFENLASRPLRVQVVADDEVITDLDRPVLGVQVNNCPSTELSDNPAVDPCDGYADVLVSFAPHGFRRVRKAFRQSRPEHHVTHADVLRMRARTVSVAGQWFALASDGEDAGAEQRCTWQVLPEQLRVIAPERVTA